MVKGRSSPTADDAQKRMPPPLDLEEPDLKEGIFPHLTSTLLPTQREVLHQRIKGLHFDDLFPPVKEEEINSLTAPLNPKAFYRDITIVDFAIRLTKERRRSLETNRYPQTHKAWDWVHKMEESSFWVHLFCASHSGTGLVEGFDHIKEDECYQRYPHLRAEREKLERADSEWQKRFNPNYSVASLGNVPIAKLMAAPVYNPTKK